MDFLWISIVFIKGAVMYSSEIVQKKQILFQCIGK